MIELTFKPDDVDWAKGNGLVPVVIQDATTLQVLMLGYMDRPALEATAKSGLVTFYSRSKQRLWQKGEILRPRARGRRYPPRLRQRHPPYLCKTAGPHLPSRHQFLLRRGRAEALI